MNRKWIFSFSRVTLLYCCAFILGMDVANYITGNASTLSAALGSASLIIVTASVTISARTTLNT